MTTPAPDWRRGLPMMAGPYFVGLYQPSPETAFFWEGVEAGELRLRKCPTCQRVLHPKRIVCTECGETDLTWVQASGRGTVYSFSEVHRAAVPEFAAATPYVVGLVQLAEGVYLFTRFIPGDVRVAIGAPVEVAFQALEQGRVLPVFRVVAS